MGTRGPVFTIFMDAFLLGWGAILGYKTARRLWPSGEKVHMNTREAGAIWLKIL